jgi:hypothetical protein
MAHIYMSFDFGADEEKAQQARHKLEMWKQAFRLDKKLLYKFERPGGGVAPQASPATTEEEAGSTEAQGTVKPGATKGGKKVAKTATKASAAKGKAKEAEEAKKTVKPAPAGPVKLHLRLGFSAHEKMTEERLVKKIPGEEPFSGASPAVMRQGEPGFDVTAAVFDALD